MEKNNLKLKDKEIKNDSKIEVDSINLTTTGSLSQDILNFEKINKINIEEKEVPEIELQEIIIKETGNFLNLKENSINIPIEMILLPFFTPQKQNKRVNFRYTFEDLGVVMSSTLIVRDKKDKVFQPSTFEEKIYMFLISMYNSELEKQKINSKSNGEEEKEIVLEFEISDFIVKFLGNKMNRTYYSKVEQALKNLKNTQYQFEISNHTKFGENKFEDKEFKLLTYQKLKTGKKIYYRVFLDKNIANKIKSKRYIKYNTKNLLEIMAKDHIASRIYQYISKLRYKDSTGNINIRTIAAIIPLKIEQITERETKSGIKRYVLNRMKPVLTRILKAFDVLVKLGYIKTYEEKFVREEDTYYISYLFNKDRDGDCHFSEYINKSKKGKNIVKENIAGEEQIIDLNEEINLLESIEDYIKKAKENNKISSKWNKWVDNKIKSILEKNGEIILKKVLVILKDIDKDINTTLVAYINGILKNITKNKEINNKNMSLFKNVNKEKGGKSKNQIKQLRKREFNKFENFQEIIQETKFENENIIVENDNNIHMDNNKKTENNLEILDRFDELTKIEIEEKALTLFKNETGESSEVLKNIKKESPKIFYMMLNKYILKIIQEEYKNL